MWAVYGTGWLDRCQDIFLSVLGGSGTLCGNGQTRLAGGWVFVTVRLLLLYIVINMGKRDLTVFKIGVRGEIFVRVVYQ